MKILVHLHLFYQDMLPEMLTLLRSLDGYEYDLFATVVNASPETLAELRRFKPEVTVIDVENRGYDVAPFVRVLQLADLSRYDYVIKLHTKQNLKRRAWLKNVSFTGSGWRRLLVQFYGFVRTAAADAGAFSQSRNRNGFSLQSDNRSGAGRPACQCPCR